MMMLMKSETVVLEAQECKYKSLPERKPEVIFLANIFFITVVRELPDLLKHTVSDVPGQ